MHKSRKAILNPHHHHSKRGRSKRSGLTFEYFFRKSTAENLSGEKPENIISIPQDIFTVTANMFAAGKIRYLTMLGEALYRGKALIHSIDFGEDYNRKDFK